MRLLQPTYGGKKHKGDRTGNTKSHGMGRKSTSDGFIKHLHFTEFTPLMTDENNYRYGWVADTDKSQ